MKLRTLIYLLSIFFFLIACKKETQKETQELVLTSTIDTLHIPIATGLKPSLRLIPKAQKTVKGWKLYQTVSKRLDSLQDVSLGLLKIQLQNIIPSFNGLETAQEEENLIEPIPIELRKPAIKARLLTLETQLKVLNNYAQKSDPNAQEIATAVVSLKNAFQNLNTQINQNFALTPEEIEKEIKENFDKIINSNTQKLTPRGKPPIEIYKTQQ